MQTNATPHLDNSINTTGCCAKFNPEGWDGQRLHFEDKGFVQATARSFLHIPINMGRVFGRVQKALADAGVADPEYQIVLSRDPSPWKSEHLFATPCPVPGERAVTLSGDFVTKVFEGPYRDAGKWFAAMQDLAKSEGTTTQDIYFYYTTCPKCAKAYGQNYVVGLARIA